MKKIVIVEKRDNNGRVYIKHLGDEMQSKTLSGFYNVFSLINNEHKEQKECPNGFYIAEIEYETIDKDNHPIKICHLLKNIDDILNSQFDERKDQIIKTLFNRDGIDYKLLDFSLVSDNFILKCLLRKVGYLKNKIITRDKRFAGKETISYQDTDFANDYDRKKHFSKMWDSLREFFSEEYNNYTESKSKLEEKEELLNEYIFSQETFDSEYNYNTTTAEVSIFNYFLKYAETYLYARCKTDYAYLMNIEWFLLYGFIFKKSDCIMKDFKDFIIKENQEFLKKYKIIEKQIKTYMSKESNEEDDVLYEIKISSNKDPVSFIESISEYTGGIYREFISCDFETEDIINDLRKAVEKTKIRRKEQKLYSKYLSYIKKINNINTMSIFGTSIDFNDGKSNSTVFNINDLVKNNEIILELPKEISIREKFDIDSIKKITIHQILIHLEFFKALLSYAKEKNLVKLKIIGDNVTNLESLLIGLSKIKSSNIKISFDKRLWRKNYQAIMKKMKLEKFISFDS